MAEFDILAIFKVSGTAELNASLKKINKAAGQLGTSIKNVGRDAATFGRNIAAIGTAGAAALGKTVLVAKDFEEGFTSVVTLLDESSFQTKSLDEGISDLRKGIISLRATSGQSFDTLNKGLFDLISATGDAENGIRNLDVATQLAISGNTDVATAVVGLTNVLGAYGDEAGSVEEIAQKFFAAQKDGRTTIEELSKNIGVVASTAKATGISFEELLSVVSAATVAGIDTNRAFTGVAAAIDNITKPSADAAKEAERLGVGFNQTALESVGLLETLRRVTQSANFTSESFTKLFGSREGRNFANALAADFGKASGTLLTLNNRTQLQTTFNNALAVSQGTIAQQLARFGGLIESVSVVIGTALSPAVGELIDIFTKVITELQPEIEAFFQQLGQDIVDFVKGGNTEIPKIVETFREFGSSVVVVFTSVVNAGRLLISVVKAILVPFEVLAAFLPGINGQTLALLVVFGQLTGAFKLAGSTLGLLFSTFKLFDTILLTTGVISTGLGTTFGKVMLSMATAAFSAIPKIITSIVALGTSMTSFGGILGVVGTAARAFWIAVTGPVGIAVAIGAAIALIVGKLVGFENIVNGIARAWDAVVGAIGKAVRAVADFFGGSDSKDINVNVNRQSSSAQTAGLPEGFSGGGKVRGKGTSTSDSILARLSNGEYVVKAAAVRMFGTGFMDSINSGILPTIKGFADGGLVDAINRSSSTLSSQSPMALIGAPSQPRQSSGRPLNLVLPNGDVIKTTTDEDTAARLQKNLRRADSVKTSAMPSWY